MTKTLTIAGRPNVGKSTLFNRLVGKSLALVSDVPGVTRDYREAESTVFGEPWIIIDTAGLEAVRAKDSIPARTARQTHQALTRSDVILLIVDGQKGLTNEDQTIARELRKCNKPIFLVANKCESTRIPATIDEFAKLGFGEPILISATHGDGITDIGEALLPFESRSRRGGKEEGAELASALEDVDLNRIHIAVVGRPNVGKSTLINRLIGEERMLTGPEPGLTRDAIPLAWTYDNYVIRLIDTAGMRRRARVSERLEKLSVQETLRAIRLAHVVVVVIDAESPLDKQDLLIAEHVLNEGRAMVLIVNKWDLVKDKKKLIAFLEDKVTFTLSQAQGLTMLTLSALKGDGMDRLMEAVVESYQVWNKRIPTSQLNRWLEKVENQNPPPITKGRRLKLRYMSQIKTRPPTFSLWVNKPVDLPDSYLRYLTNELRKAFQLVGVPIRWQLKKNKNPYEDKKRD